MLKLALLVFLASSYLVAPVFVQAADPVDEGDFRNADWGMSVAEVLEIEGREPVRADETLVMFSDTIYDTPAAVVYLFVEDELVMGFFQLLVSHDDLNNYFTEYETLRNRLSREFGQPEVENWQYTDDEIENQRDIWGDALGYGLLKVETGWVLRDTAIALRLSGGNFAAHLLAVFTSSENLDRGRVAFYKYFRRRVGVPNPYFRR